MITASSFRNKFLSSLSIGYDWLTSRHFAEIAVTDYDNVIQTFRVSGLSDYNICEDFGSQHISQCTLIIDPSRMYLSLDPYTEGAESEQDNYTFSGTKIELR